MMEKKFGEKVLGGMKIRAETFILQILVY